VGHIASEAADKCGIRQVAGIHFDMVAARDILEQELHTNSHAAVRILSLLLENAIKYTGEGSVTLRIVRKQGFLYFLVEDTGIGVPAQEAEHIFEHFVQLDDYREGTGIGLSLARSLARRLGGDVVLDTSYSFGARFVFSLPLTAE
jgi:signal transduction histidine kinase